MYKFDVDVYTTYTEPQVITRTVRCVITQEQADDIARLKMRGSRNTRLREYLKAQIVFNKHDADYDKRERPGDIEFRAVGKKPDWVEYSRACA